MQVVFVKNSAKSPTACRKRNSAIRNEWKFRSVYPMHDAWFKGALCLYPIIVAMRKEIDQAALRSAQSKAASALSISQGK